MSGSRSIQLMVEHTFGFIVKISSVRSVESLRSRSVIGIDNVEVDVRLSVVGAVSSDCRPLCCTAISAWCSWVVTRGKLLPARETPACSRRITSAL